MKPARPEYNVGMEVRVRQVERVIEPQPVVEGAGVHLKRSLGARTLDYLDPFLLFDDFSSPEPRDFEAGFPLHPHRGIETVTYILQGEVRHKDTLGNSGSIGAGDVQWMTAGRGIMHEEMPQAKPGGILGFQLWVNLPAKLKMTRPRYQDIRADQIREVRREDGSRIRVITGRVGQVSGPVAGIAADPLYLDVSVPAGGSFTLPVERGHSAFAYLFEGEAAFAGGAPVSARRLVVLGGGDEVQAAAGKTAARFLLISGKPLGEPVARYGPFVMNTREEIEQTLREIREGSFITA